MKLSQKEFAKRVADGECPNVNCGKDGDIEEKHQQYDSDGSLSITWQCDCGTVWRIDYQPTDCIVEQKPKNYKQIS